MKKKNQKSKNGKQRRIELPQEKVEDKKGHNLSIVKKKKNKDEDCESTKTPQRNLRTRTAKNYSEKSRVVSFKAEEKEVSRKSPAIVSGNERIPIYKTVKLFEEKVNNLEEVYEFVEDDLPISDQKVKKKKKSVRKPNVNRAKKLIGLQFNKFQKEKTKTIKNVSKNVQLKEQEKQATTEPEQNNIHTNIIVPEHLHNAGDSTIAKASTVISDQKLEQSDRCNPNNSDTFQPNAEENDMINHSLITQTLSPITKEVNNDFFGSPTNTFSQVQKVVQSTPQINRVLTGQGKKTLIQINLNEKSFCSEDPTHHTSRANENLTKQNMVDLTQVKKENVALRKFGTIISNLSSVETTTTSTLKQASLQQKHDSTTKAVLAPVPFENIENEQEMQDDILPGSSISTINKRKDDNTLNTNKSVKIKNDQFLNLLLYKNIIQSLKQRVSSESKLNAGNSNSQKENRNPDLIAGPSNSEKLKGVVLRQSNLNNFLNLDEVPESTRISTAHGIYDDVSNSAINGKKMQPLFEESNREDESRFENCVHSGKSSSVKKKSVPIIATARDVARSVKGKVFLKARVKSSLTRWVPENMTRKTLLKNVLKKNAFELKTSVNERSVEENDDGNENNKSKSKNLIDHKNVEYKSPIGAEDERNKRLIDALNERNKSLVEGENENTSHEEDENDNNSSLKDVQNSSISLDPKKAFLDSVSFSDTFDLLSENGEDESFKVPDEVPLFVDLEPVHFLQPPRRSYTKIKKTVCFDTSRNNFKNKISEGEDCGKPKKKRKKVSKLSREDKKKMQQWIKSVNEQFNEIDQYNLTIE